ncbi:WhiB family transcriptional regulator [Streptomyces sp. NPDC001410]|uniref:WhiB family transcriptional regulator n=1 Tax=Streptomyces sp. NPDC001410 TaxID=3364574 RepID=UPI0036B6F342
MFAQHLPGVHASQASPRRATGTFHSVTPASLNACARARTVPRWPAFARIEQIFHSPWEAPHVTSELDWRRAAACANLPPRLVFTRDPSAARHTLRACNKCPIRRECEAIVDPAHSWFDGVSGGRLWRNGRAVAV